MTRDTDDRTAKGDRNLQEIVTSWSFGEENNRSRYYILALLVLVFAIQYVDRQLVSLLSEPIKVEFNLRDRELGLLTGFVFSIPYVLMLFPVGYMVDRFNRRNILAAALAIWSGFTVISGFAANLLQLCAARILVAGAEATNNPAALSMIADRFQKESRSTAIGIFFSGPALATLTVFPVIGYVAAHWGWRAAFFIAGGPGLLLSLILLMTVREPVREATSSLETEIVPSIMTTIRFFKSQRSLCLIAAGMMLTSFVQASNIAWMSPFLMRVHHLSLGEAVPIISLAFGISTATGQIIGGRVMERLSSDEAVRIGRGCSGLSLIAFISLVATALAPSLFVTIISIVGWSLCIGLLYGPTGSAIQSLVRPRMRGITTSFYALLINLIGAGLGPFVVGLISDAVASERGDQSLRYGLGSIAGVEITAALCFFLAARWLNADLARARS